MMETVPVIDFILAEKLGMPLGAVRELPNAEVVEWGAYLTYRAAMDDLAARSGRR